MHNVIRRVNRHTNTLFAVVVAAIASGGVAQATVSAALASSGGTTPSGGGSVSSGASNSPSAQHVHGRVTASANGITLATSADGMLRHPTRFTGNVGSRDAGKIVEIERRGRETGWSWAPTTHATVQRDGSFAAVWPTNHIGRFTIRAVVASNVEAHAASASPSPTLTITIYRPAIATLYGAGFYGRHTACGETLRANTIGVANRTLPCGTKVSILYQGRTLVVAVIDRGPYAHNADWDLTMATGRALGMTGTEQIGAVSLPGAR